MDKLSEDILKFLLDGKAYSDNAIIMNFGINETKLKEIYKTLKEENFLESYSDYNNNKNSLKKESSSCGNGCSKCSCEKTQIPESSTSEKKCCNEKDLDFDNILVLTEKAINWF
ncbi:MAG: hypothetical protein ACRC0V_09250 [Fusobacteriaceae bacterium]